MLALMNNLTTYILIRPHTINLHINEFKICTKKILSIWVMHSYVT